MLRRMEEVIDDGRAGAVQDCLSEVIPEARLAPPAPMAPMNQPLDSRLKVPPADDDEVLH